MRWFAVLTAAMGCSGNTSEGGVWHPPLPSVIDSGGPVQTSPTWVVITFPGDPLAAQIDLFVDALATSAYWNATVGEYGVGMPAVQHIATSNPAPVSVTDAEIRLFLEGELSPLAPGWPAPSVNTTYVVFYPQGTKITMPAQCVDYFGYHDSDGLSFAYAVIPRCASMNYDEIDTLTIVTSHELAEAATDPLPDSAPAYLHASDEAWELLAYGGEIGDMCQEAPGSHWRDPNLGYIQRMWSNAEAAAGHDPCVPHPNGDAYFQAAPQPEMSSGLHVPLGATITVDVDLFSDGAIAPMTVWAAEWAPQGTTNAPDLALTLNGTSGVNGDVLQLDITVLSNNVGGGGEFFKLYSEVGDLVHVWPVMITN